MNDTSNYLAALNHLLAHPSDRGIVGLVDDLLLLCHQHRLQLDWQRNRYLVRSGEGEWEEANSGDSRGLIFQVVMERLAVLCNEQTPNSMSPYGGKGQLRLTADEAFQVDFVNTPGQRRLQLMPIRLFAPHESNGAVGSIESERIQLETAGD